MRRTNAQLLFDANKTTRHLERCSPPAQTRTDGSTSYKQKIC